LDTAPVQSWGRFLSKIRLSEVIAFSASRLPWNGRGALLPRAFQKFASAVIQLHLPDEWLCTIDPARSQPEPCNERSCTSLGQFEWKTAAEQWWPRYWAKIIAATLWLRRPFVSGDSAILPAVTRYEIPSKLPEFVECGNAFFPPDEATVGEWRRHKP
jgi:hypothetical protein